MDKYIGNLGQSGYDALTLNAEMVRIEPATFLQRIRELFKENHASYRSDHSDPDDAPPRF